jgi:phosphatidate cytidylyltransferase
MLSQRILVAVILLPIGLIAIYLGGPVYLAMITIILLLAALEYVQLFNAGGYQPAGVFVLAGTGLLVIGRALGGFESAAWMISLLILASMAYHLLMYERGRDCAPTDFAVTLSGFLYLGWIGAYLISLRNLPEGIWWVLTVLPTVWLADSGAYFVGKSFGRHQMSRRISPKKTWEGYLGGIFAGTLGGALLPFLWLALAGTTLSITPLKGAAVGLTLSVLTVLGDLGESMIKRQVGMKDSGKLLPGHGGVFDRIDSWLWAGVLGYYLAFWLAKI